MDGVNGKKKKFRPTVRKGDNELDFERKVEKTREMLDLMNRRGPSNKSKTTINTKRT